MNSQIKQQWMEALRSGKYAQAFGALQLTEMGFCCLGVLCDLHRQLTDNGRWIDSSQKEGVCSLYVGDDFVVLDKLPSTMLDWAGLTESACDELINLNDIQKNTFDQIAAWIDVNL